jgi:aminoglycoside phosphotransferase (APT) family kinase protein
LQNQFLVVQRSHDRWHDAIRTLAKFHKVVIRDVGLENFGKANGFYDRQIKTLGTISAAQAKAVDVDTKEPVGDIPHFHEMIDFFRDKSAQPKDRSSLIHGDYKIDNLVFHKTEPKVIGILDWEMATIGHPLSDLINLTGPYSWSETVKVSVKENMSDFKPGVTPGLPSLNECIEWYKQESGYDAVRDLAWGNAFNGMRSSVIMQGIAARYAQRQASSANAKAYGVMMGPYAEWAWSVVKKVKEEAVKTKL